MTTDETNSTKEQSFKVGLEELEQIVHSLESNQLELEQSIESFERGVALLNVLKGQLDNAQQVVTVCMGKLEPESSDDIDKHLS